MSRLDFLRSGRTEQFLNWSGKTPVDIDRLMIFVIVGRRTDLHCLRREVGIGSRSQEVSGELDKSAETSAMVAGWKKDSSGGLEAGGQMW